MGWDKPGPHGRRLLCIVFAVLAASMASESNAADLTAELVARSFFAALFDGRVAAAVPLCGAEVNLDGKLVRDRAELERSLQAVSARARERRLRLKRLIVLEAAEATKRFGPPPTRLRKSLAPQALVALARLDERGAVAVLRRESRFWRIVALSD